MNVASSLIEQQIRRWEQAQKESPNRVRPCVALSRLPGTPAVEIGQLVAEQLGYGFFDIEIVDEIARSEGVGREIVSHLDEHVRHGLDRWLLDTFRGSTWTERDYLHALGRVISGLAARGSAVIMGRGATFLLDETQALRIQIVGSRTRRIERLAAARSLPPAGAEATLEAEEEERSRFLGEFAEMPDSPLHFDLVVNTDFRDPHYWASLIAATVRRLD